MGQQWHKRRGSKQSESILLQRVRFSSGKQQVWSSLKVKCEMINTNSNERWRLTSCVLSSLLGGLTYFQSFENHLYVGVSQICNSTSDPSSHTYNHISSCVLDIRLFLFPHSFWFISSVSLVISPKHISTTTTNLGQTSSKLLPRHPISTQVLIAWMIF